MELALIWIMFGVTAAVIATSKGRSFIGWLILGLLFGIFALVAVCAMPGVTARREDAPYRPLADRWREDHAKREQQDAWGDKLGSVAAAKKDR